MRSKFDILIIDDEQVVIDAAKKILSIGNYRIDQALDADTALKKLEKNNYKFILLDLMLPKVTGFELIENIYDQYPYIPIITITGYATLENTIQSFKVGVFDFVPKPFDTEELLGVAFRCLKFVELGLSQDKEKRFKLFHRVKNIGAKSKKYYFLGEHSWAKIDHDGSVIFGVGRTFSEMMGDSVSIEFPSIPVEVLQGSECLCFHSQDGLIHQVWAPLSGEFVEINQVVVPDIHLINDDPFNQGWLGRLKPTHLDEELGNLSLHYLSEETI